jgi:hypothetical protein
LIASDAHPKAGRLPGQAIRWVAVPLVIVTTTSPAHEPYVVTVDDVQYTVVTGTQLTT